MSRIENMIKTLCPEGVERVKLGDLANLIRGKVISKDYVRDNSGAYPVYSSQTDNNGEFGRIDTFMFDGDYVTWTTDGVYAGTIFLRTGQFNITNICGLIDLHDSRITVKFLYYWLFITAPKYVNRAIDNPKLMSNAVAKIKIPLPPLSVQQEIVSVLDSFTTLIDKMKKEVELRKKQMEYYREKVLSFEEGECEWKCLGELFTFKNGLNKEKKEFGKGTPIINYVDVYKNRGLYKKDIKGLVNSNESELSRFKCAKGDVFFTRTSETKEEVGYPSVLLEDIEDCVFSGFVLRASPTTKLLDAQYCKYCFFTEQFRKEVIKRATLTTRALTNGNSLSKISIPVPPLSTQHSIVRTLDAFDSYITKLEKLITLREKQYEYYREKLLTFE